MILHIIRHGETVYNAQKRLQGQRNIPLNEQGILQAEEAARYLRDAGIVYDVIYSSPLARAYETAEILGRGMNAPLIRDARLLEIGYGPYEGDPYEVLDENMFAYFRDPDHTEPPEGVEPIAALEARTEAFLEEVRERDRDKEKVLVVTHGVAIRAMVRYFLNLTSAASWSYFIGNCCIYETELADGKWEKFHLHKLFTRETPAI
ncbi:MAG: histidine phosphatase family protein [Lachnospiraceae bacterium]|nr:histidine phosphatase family protein [Lachnospiraceae bacterium]